jgi:hypothetical protein
MDILDDPRTRRALKIHVCFESLRNLEYLLRVSKPLTDEQMMYCVMLHDELERLKSLLFAEKG